MDFNSLASPYQFSVQLLWFSAFRDVISIHIQMFATTGQVNDKEWDEW